MATTLAMLFATQWIITSSEFMLLGLISMAIAFWYKVLAFGTFGWILWKQEGESRLSQAGRDFFWALFGMAFFLAISFTLAAMDAPDLIRNIVRNFAIASVVAVIIYGSRLMDAVFDMLRRQAEEDNTSQHNIPVAPNHMSGE